VVGQQGYKAEVGRTAPLISIGEVFVVETMGVEVDGTEREWYKFQLCLWGMIRFSVRREINVMSMTCGFSTLTLQ
jgi:hypothetical protein